VREMKFIFFTFRGGFSGTVLEEELVKCGARIFVNGTSTELVVLLVDDPSVEECVWRNLEIADVWVYEMEGAPRVLRYKTPWGTTVAYMKFV
jgi:hypothetical protein